MKCVRSIHLETLLNRWLWFNGRNRLKFVLLKNMSSRPYFAKTVGLDRYYRETQDFFPVRNRSAKQLLPIQDVTRPGTTVILVK